MVGTKILRKKPSIIFQRNHLEFESCWYHDSKITDTHGMSLPASTSQTLRLVSLKKQEQGNWWSGQKHQKTHIIQQFLSCEFVEMWIVYRNIRLQVSWKWNEGWNDLKWTSETFPLTDSHLFTSKSFFFTYRPSFLSVFLSLSLPSFTSYVQNLSLSVRWFTGDRQ